MRYYLLDQVDTELTKTRDSLGSSQLSLRADRLAQRAGRSCATGSPRRPAGRAAAGPRLDLRGRRRRRRAARHRSASRRPRPSAVSRERIGDPRALADDAEPHDVSVDGAAYRVTAARLGDGTYSCSPPPPSLHEGIAQGRQARPRHRHPAAGAAGLSDDVQRAAPDAAAGGHGGDLVGDRRGRPDPARPVQPRAHPGGRAAAGRPQLHAPPGRVGVPHARAQRGPAAPLRRRRLARAAHPAVRDPRLSPAVRQGHAARPGRAQAGLGPGDRRGRPHGAARRRAAHPRPPRPAARTALPERRPEPAGAGRRRGPARAAARSGPSTVDAEGSLLVRADESGLRQVLGNLVGNVRTHTPADVPVRLGVERADGVVRLCVADEGPGLCPRGRGAGLRPVLPGRRRRGQRARHGDRAGGGARRTAAR